MPQLGSQMGITSNGSQLEFKKAINKLTTNQQVELREDVIAVHDSTNCYYNYKLFI